MNKQEVLIILTLLLFILYIAYTSYTQHDRGRNDKRLLRQGAAVSESTTAEIYDYNRIAGHFKMLRQIPPAESKLDKIYRNNTRILLKKFIQIQRICNSLSAVESQNYEQFCDSLHFKYSKRIPQAIIIGVGKCGTSLMTRLLNEHPFISIPLEELNFFTNAKWMTSRNLLQKYAGLMPDTLPNQLTMEKTPGYLSFPYVPERVRPLMGDNMKFIVQFRDPVERVLSVARYFPTDINEVYYGNIKEANKTVQERYVFYKSGGGPILINEVNSVFVSKYVEGLSHWLQFYSLDNFHFVSFENISKRPLEVMKGVERFLGIPHWFDGEAIFVDNGGKVCYKTTDLAESGDIKALLKTLESQSLNISSSYSCKGSIHEHHLKEELKKILEDFFRPYNERLYNLIGINFAW